MKKRILSLLLVLCLLLGCAPAVRAEEEIPNAYCTTAEDFITFSLNCASCLVDSYEVSFSSDLDWLFGEWENVRTILYNCGLQTWSLTRNMTRRTLEVKKIRYRTGFRLAQAWHMGARKYVETDVEHAVLSNAEAIVKATKSSCSTELELERYMHDWLCRNVSYQDGGTDECTIYDTAEGALYYGKAECDGYADAFYLLCSLAGLQVGYQHGGTDNSTTGHLWNIIYMGEHWVHVDVTWDDLDDASNPDFAAKYLYFNTGGQMLDDHFWNSSLSVQQLYPYTDWDVFFYSCAQSGQYNFGAYFADMQDAAKYVIQQNKAGCASAHVMIDGYYADGVQFNDVLASAGLYGTWVTWTDQASSYTCFDVYFYR